MRPLYFGLTKGALMKNINAYLTLSDVLKITESLTLFAETFKDLDLSKEDQEYAEWARATTSFLNSDRSESDAQNLLNKGHNFLIHLPTLIESPSFGFSELLNSENIPETKQGYQRELFSVYAENLRHRRVSTKRTNVTRVLKDVFSQLNVPFPSPYKKFYYDDAGRKFVKNKIQSLFGKNAVSASMSAVLYEHWPSIIGNKEAPVSQNISCAVIWHSQTGRSVLCVTSDFQPLYLFVPQPLANSNESALAACDAEIERVSNGQPAQLGSGTYPYALSIMDPPQLLAPIKKLENCPYFTIHKQRGLRAFIDVSSPVNDLIMEQLRQVAANERMSSEVFMNGRITRPYAGALMSLNMRLDEARENLARSMDPEVMSLLQVFDIKDLETISWFSGSPGLLPSAHKKRIRTDAEDAFCATGPLFYVSKTKEFQDAVTNRIPILPVIREMTGLTKSQINVISAMPSPKSSSDVIKKFPPLDPQIMRGKSLGDIRLVSQIYEVLTKANPEKKRETIAADAARMFGSEPHHVRDIMDLIEAMEEKLIIPTSVCIHGGVIESTADFLRSLVYPKTLSKLIEANKTYHEHQMWNEFNDYGMTQTIATWSALTNPKKYGHLTIKELTSSEALRLQGQKQHHCVGDYVEHVLNGKSLILSVDKEDGEPDSTVEVSLKNNHKAFVFESTQHRSSHNRAPSDEAEFAVQSFLNESRSSAQLAMNDYLRNLEDSRNSAVRIRRNSPEHAFIVFSDIFPPKIAQAGYAQVRSLLVKRFEEDKEKNQAVGPEPQEREFSPF